MKKIEEMTLEETIENLESIVSELENSGLGLEKSMEIFEQGIKLVAHSKKLLDKYDRRITVLKKENGILTETDMEVTEDEDNE